jgi:hypothetical protein
MKRIMIIVCWFKGHKYSDTDWNLNPSTQLWRRTCKRCNHKHYINDKEFD